jgi:hypothetical protein
MIETIEFEPITTGTTIHFRYQLPRSARERAAVTALEPVYRDVFATRMAKLSELLDAEMAARSAGLADEPELPAPRTDGLLAGLTPDAPPHPAFRSPT